jgi:hypothetical protein
MHGQIKLKFTADGLHVLNENKMIFFHGEDFLYFCVQQIVILVIIFNSVLVYGTECGKLHMKCAVLTINQSFLQFEPKS